MEIRLIYDHFKIPLDENLSFEWASLTIERSFSTIGRMLTPSRKSLTKIRHNNLIMLRINVPILKALYPQQYEEKLIRWAVAPGKYHKRRSKASAATKLTFESAQSHLLFLSAIVENEREYLSDDGTLDIWDT